MTTTNWIKTFSALALADFGSIPSRLRRHFWAILAVLVRFHSRKAYEEESLFFRLLFMPVIMISMISSKIKAYRRGLSLLVFSKLERAKLEAEAEMLRQEMRQQRIRGMEQLANVMPGATVNDYEDLTEGWPFRSLMFLRNSLWKLILSDNNKRGGLIWAGRKDWFWSDMPNQRAISGLRMKERNLMSRRMPIR